MAKTANTILDIARGWIGRKESNGSHHEIIDLYNNHKPLARGYKVKYTDSWCATFVSACAIKANYTDIIPTECSCNQMIKGFQNLGRWTEDDAHVPHIGDVIFYDWQDNGVGDNKGSSDHVGIVEKVENGKITVIEGNKSDAVGRRVLNVNGRYIRGFGCPAYETQTQDTVSKPQTNTSNALGTYVITASSLIVRTGPGTGYRRKKKSELTANAREHATFTGALKKNTRVTVKEIRGGWARIPSGWVSMEYLKKI
nr:MAG TPA: CHAP domain protein [Caudoviricetes sp.]